ncbi:ribonuclease E [Streptacidiphilus sp. MAP12-33]|uniref:Rne/Rng family ribonuclease n=1 Tax=Streptacidiphilus sp. MAP12-33 TaxID=3156266 RepID=UPI003515ECC3
MPDITDNENNEQRDQSDTQAAPKAAPRRRRAASRPAGPPAKDAPAAEAVTPAPAEAAPASSEPAPATETAAAAAADEAPEPRKRARRTRKKAEPAATEGGEAATETSAGSAGQASGSATEAAQATGSAAEAAAAGSGSTAEAAPADEAPEPRKRARRTRKKAEAVPADVAAAAESGEAAEAPAAAAVPAAAAPADSLALLGELDQVEQQVEAGLVPGTQLEALVGDLVARVTGGMAVAAGSELERRLAALRQRAAAAVAPAAEQAAPTSEEPAPRSRRRAVRPATAVFQAPVFQAPEPAAEQAAPAVVERRTAPAAAFVVPDEAAAEPRRRGRRRVEAPAAAVEVETAESVEAVEEAVEEATTGRRRARRRAAAPAVPTESAVFEQVATREPLAAEEEHEEEHEEAEAEEPSFGRRRRRRATSPAFVTVEQTEDDADEDEDDEAAEAEEQHTEEGRPSRRRRRGGRRRRRGEGDIEDHESTEAEDGEEDEEGEDDELGEALSASSRRRRRRRRRSGDSAVEAEPTDGDPERTVVKVREPRRRTAEAPFDPDEVQSIKGSTRLEAKKQRRREGREQGRRRVPIITEAEFLARREAVERVMVVRQSGERTQIGVLEDNVLVEHYVNKEQASSYVGNVYLGKVQNVLPSMEAAFVDIGKGRNAVLYAGEVNFSQLGLKNGPRRIESVLKSGQSVLVQVSKDPIGHKGARLTSQISLPGRYLVYVPEGSMTGISRKLPDTERARLKSILKKIVPDDAGVIVRTAAEGASEEELTRDVLRLQQQWEDIQKKANSGNAPVLLYGEPDMTVRVVRDIFNEDFSKVIVSGETAWTTIHEYVSSVAPDLTPRLQKWTSEVDIFATYRIDEQLMKALDRKVWLPSGGSLVIDKTEAMVVVDVNTGKFTGQGGNLEETVTRNNIEAAEEIVRQLRLRDLGGIVVIDFIDMVLESNRDLVLRRLLECLGRDRTKHQVAEVTSLGLVQMTRKRVGQGLLESFSETCVHCNGRGVIVHMDQAAPAPKGFAGPKPGVGGGQAQQAEEGGSKRRRRGRGGAGEAAEVHEHEDHAHADHEHEEIELVEAEPVTVQAVVAEPAPLTIEAVVAASAAPVVDAAAQAEAEALVDAMIEAPATRGRTRRRAVRKATTTVGAEPAVVVIPSEATAGTVVEQHPLPIVEAAEAVAAPAGAEAPVEGAEVDAVETADTAETPAAPARKRAARKVAAKKVAAKKTAAKKTATKRTSKKAAASEPEASPASE